MTEEPKLSDGQALAVLAGEVVADELDWWLDRLFALGEPKRPERPADGPLADEYRLVGSRPSVGVFTVLLGVVNEPYALRKANEARVGGVSVIVQRRKVLRGSWEPLQPSAPGGAQDLS